MTREEAVNTILYHKHNVKEGSLIDQALDVAIHALRTDGDTISRQAAIDAAIEAAEDWDVEYNITRSEMIESAIKALPSAQQSACEYWDDESNFCALHRPHAQPERDIPIKPIETTDRAWGIPKRQAVCPKCDYYLGHVAFLGGYKGKRVTYCETCGQAIDWEGWDFDE